MTAHPADVGSAGAEIERLVEVVDLLRQHCPWTAALDHALLLTYLVEETYELYEVVDDVARAGDSIPAARLDPLLDDLRGELGDLLYQVVLHARLQAERGTFGFADVARGLTDKLVRRNSHVFDEHGALRDDPSASVEDIVSTWRQVKRTERPERASPFDGIPRHLPALALAAKTLARAAESRPDVAAAVPMSDQRSDPPSDRSASDLEAAVGAELLAATRRAVESGVDPERALRRAVLELQRGVTNPTGH